MSKNKSIIVKKVIKKAGGGHHGGAWKVAYADFVTAMMAFFLLMWLLNMTSEEKRVKLSTYFKHFSIYDQGGTSFMDKSSDIFSESGESKQKVFNDKQDKTIENADTSDMAPANVGEALEKEIAKKLGDLKDQVLIDTTDEGTRIQVIDKEGSLMFEQGNNKLTPKAKEVLRLISENLKNYSNKIIIEGHTDALPYAGSQYSNWELSTERASSARKALEAAGLDPGRITRVAGYADTDPLIKDNPHDPRNRRISITLSNAKNNKPKTPEVQGDTKQLKEASKEILSIIDNKRVPADISREKSRVAEDSANKHDKNNAVIKSHVKPATEPNNKDSNKTSPIKGTSNKEAVITELSQPVIIKENFFPSMPAGK